MGIEGIMETIIYLVLFASAFALLGFVIGNMHGKVPKQRRDARGRFAAKPKYFWADTNVPRHLPPPVQRIPAMRFKGPQDVKISEVPLSAFEEESKYLLGYQDAAIDPMFAEVDND